MSREVDSRAKLIPQDACKGSRKQASTHSASNVSRGGAVEKLGHFESPENHHPHFVNTTLVQLFTWTNTALLTSIVAFILLLPKSSLAFLALSLRRPVSSVDHRGCLAKIPRAVCCCYFGSTTA